jgi:hypothetical protein
MNVFDEVENLCSQWETTAGNLPPDARHLLKKLAKMIVLEAGRVCDAMAWDAIIANRLEYGS